MTAAAVGLALLATLLPLGGPVPWLLGAPVALLLSLLAGLALDRPALRPGTALLLGGWVAGLVLLDDHPSAVVAVTAGVALRLWAGLPELARLVRAHRTDAVVDLALEVVGGSAVALLVVLGSRRVDTLPPLALVGALVAAGLLLLPVAHAFRHPRRG